MSTVQNMTADELTVALRRWSTNADYRVQAAVELLIEHGHWLNTARLRTLMRYDPDDDTVWLRWSQVREEFEAGRFDQSSSTERAVLDFAIALGEDRYRFSSMGEANRHWLATAARTALGGGRR